MDEAGEPSGASVASKASAGGVTGGILAPALPFAEGV